MLGEHFVLLLKVRETWKNLKLFSVFLAKVSINKVEVKHIVGLKTFILFVIVSKLFQRCLINIYIALLYLSPFFDKMSVKWQKKE